MVVAVVVVRVGLACPIVVVVPSVGVVPVPRPLVVAVLVCSALRVSVVLASAPACVHAPG